MPSEHRIGVSPHVPHKSAPPHTLPLIFHYHFHPHMQEFEHSKKATAGTTARKWKQAFKVGYIQLAFVRVCVREALRHGEANVPYLQRSDRSLLSKGKCSLAVSSKVKAQENGKSPVPMRSIYSVCAERRAMPEEF